MQNDCEIYVDPEEDEVFFGCVSEREKFVSAKLVNYAGSSPKDDCKLREVLDEWNVGEGKGENVLRNERSTKVLEEIFIDDSSDSIQPLSESIKDSSKILSDNTSVELEHNYSTPMKHKIDKSILATPKSVVKADRDGGFLKVLSEIALVKAEAEGNQKSEEEEEEEEEEEDKENKLGQALPEIKITEATPEKGTAFSPPRSVSTQLRRFRIIYSSPQEDNVDAKSKPESFEGERNVKSKCEDRAVEKLSEKEKRKSVDLIDFNECAGEPGNRGILQENTVLTDETDNSKGRVLENGIPDTIHPRTVNTRATPSGKKGPGGLRFSKEARKIVEVLKKSADDTLNFTIPEIDVEEEENSFLSPEPVAGFDVTVISTGEIQTGKSSPKILAKPADNKLALKSQTVEKDRRNLTPVTSQRKHQTMKYFSERKIYNQIGNEGKSKCAKKLPLEEKRPVMVVEKGRGGGQGDSNPISSRIPVFGGAKSGVARAVGSKTTPAKTPSGKGFKNPKFNHIESPINAYIHNKPTSLLLNVKPETKKDSLTKVGKPQTAGNERKVEEKTSKLQAVPVRLPFVEYRSATPYKIEKRPESRLPRLAPSVMKLIGNHSPKVLRHEGRFYVNSPRKEGTMTDNSTIIADPKEVSVVVSQPVQKSNTRK